MRLFSGHDTTLMPLLVALGYDFVDWPPFMSNLIFELFWCKEEKKHYVRIMFNKKVVSVAGCDQDDQGLVELGQLEEMLKPALEFADYGYFCNKTAAEHQGGQATAGVSNGVE